MLRSKLQREAVRLRLGLSWKTLQAGMQELKTSVLGVEYSTAKSAKLVPNASLGQVSNKTKLIRRDFKMVSAWKTCLQEDPGKSALSRLHTNFARADAAESSRRATAYMRLMERVVKRHSETIVAPAPAPAPGPEPQTIREGVVVSRIEPVWKGEVQGQDIIADILGDTQGSKVERVVELWRAESVKRKRNSKMNKHKHRKRKKKAKFKKRKV